MSKTREIEIVKVYRVKGDQKKYRTYKAVVSRLAWMIVFDKYGDSFDDYGIYTGMKSLAPNAKCECDGQQYDQPHYNNCPVHDRRTGYIKRLHVRLVNYITLRYPANHLAI